jgi:hypothetical protein
MGSVKNIKHDDNSYLGEDYRDDEIKALRELVKRLQEENDSMRAIINAAQECFR